MTTKELTINQALWLSMSVEDTCPHCNKDIKITPDIIGYRLPHTRMRNNKVISKDEGGYFTECPKCDKLIKIAVHIEFSK